MVSRSIDRGQAENSGRATVVIEDKNGTRTELPIIDDGLKLFEYKDAPLSFGRRAEVHYPVSGLDDRRPDALDTWYSLFATDKPSPDPAPLLQADIYVQRLGGDGTTVNGSRQHLLRGVVSAVGGEEGPNTGYIEVDGPAMYISQLPAGNTFQYNAGSQLPSRRFLEYVRDEFVDGQPFFDVVKLRGDGLDTTVSTERFTGTGTRGSKSFKTNRDTLRDVVTFVEDKANVRVWFSPRQDGGLWLNVKRDPGEVYDATKDGQWPYVIENRGLVELRPFNTLVLKGSDESFIGGGDLAIKTVYGDGTYPEAVATYPPLVRQAGGKQIKRVETTDAVTEGAIAEEAKSLLKQQLDEISGGTMRLALSPKVGPFDRIKVLSAAHSRVPDDTTPIEYEVGRAVHKVMPDSNSPYIHHTELATSMSIDPSLIDVTTATKDTQTSKQSSNKPSNGSDLLDSLDFITKLD